MSDALLVDCPACDAPALRKQVTAAAFKLKGSGWYETDFKNSGKAASPNTADTSKSKASKSEGSSLTNGSSSAEGSSSANGSSSAEGSSSANGSSTPNKISDSGASAGGAA